MLPPSQLPHQVAPAQAGKLNANNGVPRLLQPRRWDSLERNAAFA